MEPMNTFEQQLARVASEVAGPAKPVDALALVRSAKAAPLRWSVVARWLRGGSATPKEGRFDISSALKFIVAGVIVALFGGFLLAGVLTTQPSDEVLPLAVTESPSPMATAPVFFSWSFDEDEVEHPEWYLEDVTESARRLPGFMAGRGHVVTGVHIEADDPRASGLATIVDNQDTFLRDYDEAPEAIFVQSVSQRLVNEGGSWSGTGHRVMQAPEPPEDRGPADVSFTILTGEGRYEGMTLILVGFGEGEEGWGWIVPQGSAPPVPELPADVRLDGRR